MPYAMPQTVTDLVHCQFYHTIEIPGYGVVKGEWDLRGLEATYLGGIGLKDKRVLEIGTAGGFLCFYMERQGADVVGYDLSQDYDWDTVPFFRIDYAAHVSERRRHVQRINNAFWLAHRALDSRARVVYGDIYRIPNQIGRFHVTTFGSVLLHCHDPFSALLSAARLTDETIVVTELMPVPESGAPTMEFLPDFRASAPVDTWWRLSPEIIQNFLGVLGFEHSTVTRFAAPYRDRQEGLYTVVAHRVRPEGSIHPEAAAESNTDAPMMPSSSWPSALRKWLFR
jgi:SAM-dependent methyltransferase